MPLLLILAIITPAALAYGWARLGVSYQQGQPGVGDPYYPDYGSSGYDALKYTIDVAWNPSTEELSGTTMINAVATGGLDSFYVDLALEASSVEVNGQPATFDHEGFQDLKIEPASPIPAGSPFEVMIDYAGQPGELNRDRIQPWWTSDGEWTVAGEPESSAWWFPANDHPSDPALMDVSVRVPAGMEAISIGRLESKDTGSEQDFDTWRWVARQPMATYLSFMSIGQFRLEEGVASGRPYVYAVSEKLNEADQDRALAELGKSAAIIDRLEEIYGPYPFSEFGGIVPIADFWFGGLETQTRPVYQSSSLLSRDFAERLLVHELSHMWFGDHVTMREWNDIFINEAYASWSAWEYASRTGGTTADEALRRTYERTKDEAGFWRTTMIDPGREELFGTVYVRGPMALQALRKVIGEEAFNELTHDWAQDPGIRSLEDWMARAQSKTTIDLDPFFQAWIYGDTAPAPTRENGLA